MVESSMSNTLAYQSIDQSTNHSNDQSIDDLPPLEVQPVDQSIDQSINQSINRSSAVKEESQSTNQSVDQSVKPENSAVIANQSVKDEKIHLNQSINQSIIPPTSYQPNNQSINQSDDDLQEIVRVIDDSDEDMPLLSQANTNNQSNNQSNDQSRNQSSNSNNQSINQPVNQSIDPVDLDVVMSANDPATFIAPFLSFVPSTDQSTEYSHQYQLSIASSGRAKCKICRKNIENGYPRYGINELKYNHMLTKWYHPACFLLRYLPKFKFDADTARLIREHRGMVNDLNIYTRALDAINASSDIAWEPILERHEERESQKAAWLATANPEDIAERNQKKIERRERKAAKLKAKKRREKEKAKRQKEREDLEQKKQEKREKLEEKKRQRKEQELANNEMVDDALNGRKRTKKETKTSKIKGEALSSLIDQIDRGDVVAVKSETGDVSVPRVKREPGVKREPAVKRESIDQSINQSSEQPNVDSAKSSGRVKRKRSVVNNDVKPISGVDTENIKRPRTRSMK